MPGSSHALIVGGGIQAGVIAVDQFLFVVTVSPPLADSSPRLIRRTSSIEILGDGALSTAIGNNAVAGGAECVVIGRDCSSFVTAATPQDTVLIGQNVKTTGAASNTIVIGHDLSVFGNQIRIGSGTTPLTANDLITIGFGVTVSGTANGVAVGQSTTLTGGGNLAIGTGASAGTSGTSLGTSAVTAGSNGIAIGNACDQTGTTSNSINIGTSSRITNLTNVVFIGANLRTDNGTYAAGDMALGNYNLAGSGFTSRWIFGGDVHTSGVAVPAATMRVKDAAGTDIAGGNLTVQGSRGTGTGLGGLILFQTADTGATSNARNALRTRLTIGRDTQPSVTVAAPNAGGAETLTIEALGGAGVPSLRLNGLTDGAGAAGGTLLNAPSAGNPSFWVPVSIAGAVRYIPAWT